MATGEYNRCAPYDAPSVCASGGGAMCSRGGSPLKVACRLGLVGLGGWHSETAKKQRNLGCLEHSSQIPHCPFGPCMPDGHRTTIGHARRGRHSACYSGMGGSPNPRHITAHMPEALETVAGPFLRAATFIELAHSASRRSCRAARAAAIAACSAASSSSAGSAWANWI